MKNMWSTVDKLLRRRLSEWSENADGRQPLESRVIWLKANHRVRKAATVFTTYNMCIWIINSRKELCGVMCNVIPYNNINNVDRYTLLTSWKRL